MLGSGQRFGIGYKPHEPGLERMVKMLIDQDLKLLSLQQRTAYEGYYLAASGVVNRLSLWW